MSCLYLCPGQPFAHSHPRSPSPRGVCAIWVLPQLEAHWIEIRGGRKSVSSVAEAFWHFINFEVNVRPPGGATNQISEHAINIFRVSWLFFTLLAFVAESKWLLLEVADDDTTFCNFRHIQRACLVAEGGVAGVKGNSGKNTFNPRVPQKWAQSKLLTFQPRLHDTPMWAEGWVCVWVLLLLQDMHVLLSSQQNWMCLQRDRSKRST